MGREQPATIHDRYIAIAEEYGRLLSRIDAWFARCMENHGSEISCADGCSDCCRGLFDITLLDAWYLRLGFDRLPEEQRQRVLAQARKRVAGLAALWPEYSAPYLLNHRPEEEWEALMPDDDETPCVLLDEAGRCLVYQHRPMTCRLHGLPLVDLSGEVLHDEWCTMNFIDADPLASHGLRDDFSTAFRDEVRLFRKFVLILTGREFSELDTFIPAALLIDFDAFTWADWAAHFHHFENDPL